MGHLTDTRNRFEVKYLIAARDVPRLEAELLPWLAPDGHAEPGRGYQVYSVYWDSPEWATFWEKVEGLKVRRKLRLRRYVGGADVWLEVKQRIDRTQQKRRLRLPADVARAVLDPGTGDDDGVPFLDHPVVQEARILCRRARLAPRMAILYRRRPYVGRWTPTVRVNFDTRIQYRARGIDLTEPFVTGKYVLDPDEAVMEIKYTGRVPLWLTKAIARFGLPVVRMSKYCSAVDREHFGRTLT